jgi:hypothetical protein
MIEIYILFLRRQAAAKEKKNILEKSDELRSIIF